MKFKLGQVVQHKVSKEKVVLIKYYPKRWYRKYPYYYCSNGAYLYLNHYHLYEDELEEVKEKSK